MQFASPTALRSAAHGATSADKTAIASAASPSASSSLLLAHQLYHIIAQLYALRTQVQPKSVNDSPFDSAMHSALDAALSPLESLVLQSFVQSDDATSASNPLRLHWSLLPAQRQMVLTLIGDQQSKLSEEEEGLAKIRLCLTEKLRRTMDRIQTEVKEHREMYGIKAKADSDVPLSGDLLQLHAQCTAMHADVRKIDGELERMQQRMQRFSQVQVKLQERRTPTTTPAPRYKSPSRLATATPAVQSSSSPAIAALHSTPAPLSAASSRYSTPLSRSSEELSESSASSASSVHSSASDSFSATSRSSHASPSSDLQLNSSHMQLLHFSPILPAQSPVQSESPAKVIADEIVSVPSTPSFVSSSVNPSNEQDAISAADISAVAEEPAVRMLFDKLCSGSPHREVQLNCPQVEFELDPVVSTEEKQPALDSSGLVIHVIAPPPQQEHKAEVPALQTSDELAVAPVAVEPLQVHSPAVLTPLTQRRHATRIALASLSPVPHTPQQELLSHAPKSPLQPLNCSPLHAHSRLLGASPSLPSHRAPALISPELQAQLDTPFSALKQQQQRNRSSIGFSAVASNATPAPPSSLSLLLRQQEEEERQQGERQRRMQWMKQMHEDNTDVSKLYDSDDADELEEELQSQQQVQCLLQQSDNEAESFSSEIPQMEEKKQQSTPVACHSTVASWQASFEMRSNAHVRTFLSSLQSYAMMDSPAPHEAALPRPAIAPHAAARQTSARALLRKVQRINVENQLQPTPIASKKAIDSAAAANSPAANETAKVLLPSECDPSLKKRGSVEWFDVAPSRTPLRDITNEFDSNGHWIHSPHRAYEAAVTASLADQAESAAAVSAARAGGAGMAPQQITDDNFVQSVVSPLRYSFFRPEAQTMQRQAAAGPAAAVAAAAIPVAVENRMEGSPVAAPVSARSSVVASRPARRVSLVERASANANAGAAASASSSKSSASAASSSPAASSSASARARPSSGSKVRPVGVIAPAAKPVRAASAAKLKPTRAASASSSVLIRIPASLQSQQSGADGEESKQQ